MNAESDPVETVDGELMLAIEQRPDGIPAELPSHLAAELVELIDAARDYAAHAQAENTSRAYASDWRQFEAWCERYGLSPLPAPVSVVTFYVTSLAKRGRAVSTIRRHAAAIARAHRQAGHLPPTSDPAFLTVLEGIARVHGAAARKKTALMRDPILEMVDRIDTGHTSGLRDRALVLVGFALGLRRSELVAIRVEDLSRSPDGMTIRIAKSKTDQQGRGTELLLVYAQSPNPCPVRALRAWLRGSGVTEGPVFRRVTRTGAISSALTAQSVALIIKRRARAAGLDPSEFAGHSLRSGYATQAARDGHHPTQIADTTRHKDQRVLAGYIRAGHGRDDVAHVL
ncbi:MAG TPA: site-specific integrase [Solirubrobacteraceae bacterium]|jgi:site-specific recombinase XerD|nr:site-specific integrase [Solirubrobacteraceae bacterium]